MANDGGESCQGGILFHDFHGLPPLDPRPCTHSPVNPARIEVFRGRVERGFRVFHPDDVPADPELTARDCEHLREVARFRLHFRVLRRKCEGNGKGTAVEEVHGALALQRAGEPAPEEHVERAWLALGELRQANTKAVERLLGKAPGPARGREAPVGAGDGLPAPPAVTSAP
jgi:hypothetical protein